MHVWLAGQPALDLIVTLDDATSAIYNFSASGLKRQDNDLIVIESAEAAGAFKRAFDTRFASGGA